MLTDRQNKAVGVLKPKINSFLKEDAKRFVQKEKLGQVLSFEFAESLIERSIKLFQELNDINWEPIPTQLIETINIHADQAIALLGEIANFSPSDANPEQVRRVLVERLENEYQAWFATCFPLIKSGVSGGGSLDFEGLKSQVKLALETQSDSMNTIRTSSAEAKTRLESEIEAIRKEATDEARQKLQEVEEALSSVRKLASEAGVSQHARVFDEEARGNMWYSYGWMAAITVFGSLLGLLAFHVIGMDSWSELNTGSQAVDYRWFKPLAEKIAFAFVLLFGLFWSARNYAASRHNEVINRHRMNALRSFETFVKAATDDSTKNAVLIQATQSIFAPQATGYVKTDGDNSASSPIIELIRTTSSSSKKD